ncbi:MAG: hypothetical protein IPN29_00160 [Saprospiraceae bacterium]|nr:hypothetical protein [Saprospiraceae bacterium]
MSQFSWGEWMGMASFMLQAGVQTLANGMILRLDILMVGLLMGPWYAGMYGIILFMTSTLEIASKAISQISAPIIAENWINGKTEEIGRIYSKSALILTAISCLLFSLLYFNFPYIFSLMPNTNYDASWLTVMVVLSIARIIDLCFSLNGVLLSYSKYNKINIGMLLCSGILYFILIVNLIPKMGMLGAAVSYLTVIILLNLSKYIFIKVKIGLDPVGWGLLQIFGITALTFLINFLLPPFQFILAGIIAHTALVLMVYMPLLIYFNPSPDITDTIKGLWNKTMRKG